MKTRITRSFFPLALIIALAALSTAPVRAQAADSRETCKVRFLKEGNLGSIFISFDADSEEDCKKMEAPDVEATYSPQGPKAAPAEPKAR